MTSRAGTLACPNYGQCSIEIDNDTCLFMSRKPQRLFSNDICAELPNGTLHAFKIPWDSLHFYFYPPTLFWPYPGYCPYFQRAAYYGYVTLKYRNAWLIVGVDTESETSNEKIIRLHLQHAVTKQEDMIRYRVTDKKLEPIGNYTIINYYEVLEEIYARNPSKENPLAIVVYLWDNMVPQHGWQHVRTFAQLLPEDEDDARAFTRRSRATCVFPSLRKLCKSFNEKTGECTCHAGLSGTFCEKDINECNQSPCNTGECKNTHGSYHCICTDGWIGKHCETDVNECNYPYLCGSRGTCRNTAGSYKCDCSPGLTGKHCDTDFEECTQQPSLCQPHGKCIDIFGSYICHCNPGWTGSNCENDLDECKSGEVLCFNSGTCENTVGSYTCTCTEKWTGKQCREDINECADAKCMNGYCIDMQGKHSCTCYPGFTGERCTDGENNFFEFIRH
ncbi:EGF CA and EGF domain containing protein [Trichuris trichiura]|uniref:EGF CA and EGF domain containing protein n=1 Tax=Trichuris trichiura TaxID=36087 RepID=A0A077ZG48_TRITR|nr:EGF CA and EGF domain containing protein [Trichuris trichiura]